MSQAPTLSFTEDELSTLHRRELQSLCKKNGLKANGKNIDMIERLKELLNYCPQSGEEMVVEHGVQDETATQQPTPMEEGETQSISQDPSTASKPNGIDQEGKETIDETPMEEEGSEKDVEISSLDQSDETKRSSSQHIHVQSPKKIGPVKVKTLPDRKNVSSLTKKKTTLSQRERFDRMHDKNFKQSEDLRSFVQRRNQVKSDKMKITSPIDPLKKKFDEIVSCSPKMDIESRKKEGKDDAEEEKEKVSKMSKGSVFDRLYTPKEGGSKQAQTQFLKKGERVKSLKRLRYDPSQSKSGALPYCPHVGALPALSTANRIASVVGAAKFRKVASSSSTHQPPKNMSENMAKMGKDRRVAALSKKRMRARKVLREKKALM
jgi:hypothetical protein